MAEINMPSALQFQHKEEQIVGGNVYPLRSPRASAQIQNSPSTFPQTSLQPSPLSSEGGSPTEPASTFAFATAKHRPERLDIDSFTAFSFSPAKTSPVMAPPFSFGTPATSPSTGSLRASPTRASRPSGGHTQRGSELIASSSPTKSEHSMPPPTVADRKRGHAHRRSAAISQHDFSNILKSAKSPAQHAGSIPISPATSSSVSTIHPAHLVNDSNSANNSGTSKPAPAHLDAEKAPLKSLSDDELLTDEERVPGSATTGDIQGMRAGNSTMSPVADRPVNHSGSMYDDVVAKKKQQKAKSISGLNPHRSEMLDLDNPTGESILASPLQAAPASLGDMLGLPSNVHSEGVNFDQDNTVVMRNPEHDAPRFAPAKVSHEKDTASEDVTVAQLDLDEVWNEADEKEKERKAKEDEEQQILRSIIFRNNLGGLGQGNNPASSSAQGNNSDSSSAQGNDSDHSTAQVNNSDRSSAQGNNFDRSSAQGNNSGRSRAQGNSSDRSRAQSLPNLPPMNKEARVNRVKSDEAMAVLKEEDEEELLPEKGSPAATNDNVHSEGFTPRESSFAAAEMMDVTDSGSDMLANTTESFDAEMLINPSPDFGFDVEIVDPVDEPRFSVVTKSSDESTITPTMTNDALRTRPLPTPLELGTTRTGQSFGYGSSNPSPSPAASSFDSRRLGTGHSAATERSGLGYPTEEAPSLTSSASTTNSHAVPLTPTVASRGDAERSHSVSAADTARPATAANANERKRRSFASLTLLNRRSRSTLNIVSRPGEEDAEPGQGTDKKKSRVSRFFRNPFGGKSKDKTKE